MLKAHQAPADARSLRAISHAAPGEELLWSQTARRHAFASLSRTSVRAPEVRSREAQQGWAPDAGAAELRTLLPHPAGQQIQSQRSSERHKELKNNERRMILVSNGGEAGESSSVSTEGREHTVDMLA